KAEAVYLSGGIGNIGSQSRTAHGADGRGVVRHQPERRRAPSDIEVPATEGALGRGHFAHAAGPYASPGGSREVNRDGRCAVRGGRKFDQRDAQRPVRGWVSRRRQGQGGQRSGGRERGERAGGPPGRSIGRQFEI